MDRTFVFLAVLAAFVILCQWFVFSSIRTYLLQKYDPITRKVAYSVLVLLGVLNIVGSRLALDSDVVPADTVTRQLASVAYFSYLGSILALCLVFLVLGWVSIMLDLKSLISRAFDGLRARVECLSHGERGCLSSAPIRKHAEEKPFAETGDRCEVESSSLEPGALCADGKLAPPMARRTFLKWSSAMGVTSVMGLSAEGIAQAFEEPVLEQFDFLHPKLEGLSRPLTIAQVTDFHLGMFLDTSDLEKLVAKLNSLEFDALFITGDLFHSPMTRVDVARPILAGLKPRSIGNFAVLGNHDFYAGVQRAVDCIRQSGLTLLRDQWFSHKEGRATIHIGGIDDPMVNWIWGAEFPKFGAFMKKAPGSEGLRILLSHRPNVLPVAARKSIDFTLSGHVHGGQIIVPIGGAGKGVSIARIASAYTHGWYTESNARMYLSRGVGLTFVPWRINCPPEIALFHLKPSQDRNVRVVRTDTENRLL
jgi:uncharacterized protein